MMSMVTSSTLALSRSSSCFLPRSNNGDSINNNNTSDLIIHKQKSDLNVNNNNNKPPSWRERFHVYQEKELQASAHGRRMKRSPVQRASSFSEDTEVPQSPSTRRRPVLHFPPPPPYPPDAPFNPIPAPRGRRHAPPPPPVTAMSAQEYAYAYHECTEQRRPKLRSQRSRHNYISTYGVEENIYEEIAEARGAFENPYQFAERPVSSPRYRALRAAVNEEVQRVQRGHRRVLGELDLAMEALIMPGTESENANDIMDPDDEVGPTDELLTPDSGFHSGSGYAVGWRASCASTAGSLPPPQRESPPPQSTHRRSRSLREEIGLFAKKGWRFPGFGKDEPRARSGSWDEAARLCGGGGAVPVCGGEHAVLRQVSLEESWDSAASDVSSGDESERSTKAPSSRGSVSSNRSNGNIKATINKALTLCEKWRDPKGGGGSRVNSSVSLSSAGAIPVVAETSASSISDSGSGRLSRWFSIRRGNHYDVDRLQANAAAAAAAAERSAKMPELPEEEETGTGLGGYTFQRRQQPPNLPPPPPGLTGEQVKRRHIVAAIVHSENSYVATLQRLANDFKKPLEESSPAILSASKIGVLFHRVPEILQCHTLFRIALAESVRNWDREERLGDVFVASFSKAVVLEVYSDFINNFSIAMDLAKQESKRKSALADFLKVKQISAHDRLSFFGLMVKPVQRFPQFILFLQDLLKHTPHGHHDRMSLQLALTQLESLAEMLNERKREAEQFQAFREMLRHVSSKFAVRPLSDSNRYLLREDNVTQLEFNQQGMITKSKSRRLLLLNDLLVCVSVAPKSSDDFGSSERLSLKWTYPVTDVDVQDTSASPTLSRLLTAGLNKGGSLKSDRSNENSSGVDNLCQEMNDLMHDYEVVSRMSDLTSTLRGNYKGLTVDTCRQILSSIQASIQQKDEEIAWVDSCCLQFSIRTKPGKEEQFTFQTENPNVKKEWITELRLAQLALDPNNSPAWDIPEQERRPSTKMPLFVKAMPITRSQYQTEVRCGCYYTVMTVKGTRRPRPQSYVWVCTTDGVSSYVTVLAQQQAGLREVSSLHLTETKTAAMEFVPGIPQGSGLSGDTVWLGTDSRRLILYAAQDPEKQQEVGSCLVPAVIQQIRYHCDQTFVALASGSVLMFRRGAGGEWSLQDPQSLLLGTDPVASLLPINICMYAACGKKVWVINALNGDMQKSFSVQHEQVGNVNLMAHSGIGLWISLKNSSTICLYHTETFKHLQDINIASNVMRVVFEGQDYATQNNIKSSGRNICVTALMACKGLLWVGTNVGISLTIPLPRLEGVPIISGRVNISYHAHFGPISFLLALQPRSSNEICMPRPSVSSSSSSASSSGGSAADNSATETAERGRLEKQLSDGALLSPVAAPRLRHQLSSPVVLRRRAPRDDGSRRASKTLPRGAFSALGGSQDCDVYGLYGELMNVRDYEEDGSRVGGAIDGTYESLRRSDPELAAIPGKVSTLDRRLRIKSSRPRSLDLSNWSVDSRSSSMYTSSGSEDSVQVPSLLMPNSDKVLTSTPTQQNVNSQSISRSDGLPGSKPVDQPRTIITLMGGRGYVNWRRPAGEKAKSSNQSAPETNSNDAHIVLWEMKL